MPPIMWNPFSRRDNDDDRDEEDEDVVDATALRILARHVAEHDGLQENGAVVERMFVVGSTPQ